MTTKIEKGANVSLTKIASNVNNFFIGLSWSNNQINDIFEIDGSCFLLNEKKQVRDNKDFIFYNQQQDRSNAIYLIEDFEQNNESDKTGFGVDLNKIPLDVNNIVFCLTIHNAEEKQLSFDMFDWVSLRIVNKDTLDEIVSFRCENQFNKETAILVGELYRYKDEWKFRAIGQGYINGLGKLAENFGVSLDDISAINPTTAVENDTQLVIAKKKRKASKDVIAEQLDLISKKLKPLLPQITNSITNNINESSTRLVLDKIFQDVLGYTIDEIKTEQKIQGRAADYVLSPNGQYTFVVEAKKAGTQLRQKQIFQATSYAAYSGIQWAILTNLTEWQIYKVSTVDKVDPHLVFTIDLKRGLDEENIYNLLLISKFGILRKGLIDKVWLKKVCLRTETLIGAILNDDVISKIRTVIVRETGGQITNDEIKKAIESDILKI